MCFEQWRGGKIDRKGYERWKPHDCMNYMENDWEKKKKQLSCTNVPS